MDTTVIVLTVVIVLLIGGLVGAGVMLWQRRRSEQLRAQFGPEYDRSVREAGNRRSGEAELAEREKRYRKLDIRDLRPEERERFATSWERTQREFVDEPQSAVRDADLLVTEIMRTRGYPIEDFERRAADVSVEHPDVVQRYRDARAVRDATADGSAGTEEQRSAVTSYRALVKALLGDEEGHRSAEHDARSADESYSTAGADRQETTR